MAVIQKLVLNINNLSMKELFEAENIYRLIKAYQKQEQFLKNSIRKVFD